jgi:hypothetical protein
VGRKEPRWDGQERRHDPLRRFWLRDAMRELAEQAVPRLGERAQAAKRAGERARERARAARTTSDGSLDDARAVQAQSEQTLRRIREGDRSPERI